MIGQLKENDRVVTVGGIYGIVTNVHREADEVTIRVDDKNNTRIRVTLGAISRVLGDAAAKGESPAK
jgi:preprotein translocase subunit YajC